jgi:hypothetical protein
VVELPETATACAVTPAAPSVRVALLVPVTEDMNVILTVQSPPAARPDPQLEAAVKSGAFWPLTAKEIFERGTTLEILQHEYLLRTGTYRQPAKRERLAR